MNKNSSKAQFDEHRVPWLSHCRFRGRQGGKFGGLNCPTAIAMVSLLFYVTPMNFSIFRRFVRCSNGAKFERRHATETALLLALYGGLKF